MQDTVRWLKRARINFVLKRMYWEKEEDGTLEIVAGSGRTRLFDSGSRVLRMRELFEKLHVRLIAENSQTLLEGGPAVRRLFLDWNLFHVEPRYFDLLVFVPASTFTKKRLASERSERSAGLG